MSYAQDITALLSADTTLKSLLTGGVYFYSDAGRIGMDRLQLPSSAYDTTSGFINPVCVVTATKGRPFGGIHVPMTGYMSTVTTVLTRIYDNGDNGFGTVDDAYAQIYTLLNFKQIPNAFQILWQDEVLNQRDPNLFFASYNDGYWAVIGSKEFA